jgi:N-methylhydantoinase B
LVEKKELRPDTGGAGKYRGGLGQTIRFRVRTREPFRCSTIGDRTLIPAQGFFGGEPGGAGAVWSDGSKPNNAKAEQVLAPDGWVEIQLPGGGGYGNPAERDIALVKRDLQEGYVTAERSRAGLPGPK